jgi:hypothetical protein
LTFLGWIPKTLLIIFCSLLSQQAVSERDAPSFSSSGSYAFGLFGTKETNAFLEIRNNP